VRVLLGHEDGVGRRGQLERKTKRRASLGLLDRRESRELVSELGAEVVSEATHDAIIRDSDEESRSERSTGFVHADEVTFRVVREERFDVESHQFLVTQLDSGNEDASARATKIDSVIG
jgi:hypothetical protein